MVETFERQPLGERAYLAIKQMITTNQLGPREPIPESALAAHLGISRSPVKAALTRLQGDGLIVGEAWKVLTVAPMDSSYVDNVYHVMQSLDALCARQCIDRLPADKIDAFAAKLDVAREAIGNGLYTPVRDAHFQLNSLTIEHCGNDLLQGLEARLQDHLSRIRHAAPQPTDEWFQLEFMFLNDELAAVRERDGHRFADLVARCSEAYRVRILEDWVEPQGTGLLTSAGAA